MKLTFTILVILLSSYSGLAFCKASCATQKDQIINKPDVQVWKTQICRRGVIDYHTHKNARVIISSENAILKVLYKDGSYELIKLRKGVPKYLSKQEGQKLHEDINVSGHNLDLMVIEVIHPAT
ncbi:hypothetical protein D5018_13575 [Parashewanella curva]|uniref:DUF2541 family protein n=1 Tax=Parashewanella curva TaxID=2338552 RepID=A0A3L8PV21_9GAMM|nr:hypothetical protein [Parashewanella curva]RLV59166.1 hypothetical protein D5018_13575 [Parashewanella curva]